MAKGGGGGRHGRGGEPWQEGLPSPSLQPPLTRPCPERRCGPSSLIQGGGQACRSTVRKRDEGRQPASAPPSLNIAHRPAPTSNDRQHERQKGRAKKGNPKRTSSRLLCFARVPEAPPAGELRADRGESRPDWEKEDLRAGARAGATRRSVSRTVRSAANSDRPRLEGGTDMLLGCWGEAGTGILDIERWGGGWGEGGQGRERRRVERPERHAPPAGKENHSGPRHVDSAWSPIAVLFRSGPSWRSGLLDGRGFVTREVVHLVVLGGVGEGGGEDKLGRVGARWREGGERQGQRWRKGSSPSSPRRRVRWREIEAKGPKGQ